MKEAELIRIIDQKIITYANKVSPISWHQMAIDWNYDGSKTFLEWLIDNNNTEKATVLMIYWMSNPKKGFKFQNKLEENYISGFYNNETILFDPKDDDGIDWTKEYPNTSANHIPKIMFQKINGKKIESSENYIEGIPEDLFYEIETLYDENEIDYNN
ncbi:DUF4274 domain-containing protein [Aquimarina rubra]|uniref:DUF4274 domain-containing protein n=1 Tax=Aquimarina rubra TaxID=1920033 RepID=A0ABW5LAB0_9FLAO